MVVEGGEVRGVGWGGDYVCVIFSVQWSMFLYNLSNSNYTVTLCGVFTKGLSQLLKKKALNGLESWHDARSNSSSEAIVS